MSPRYEVDISGSKAAEFEAGVMALDGNIRNVQPLKAEVIEKWNRDATIARNLVLQVAGEHNSETTEKINSGLSKLITKTRLESITQNQDINQTRNLLVELFKSSLQEPPEGLYGAITASGLVVKGGRGTTGFLPQDIIILIEQFGLADGEPKQKRNIIETYGIKSSTTPFRIGWTLRSGLQRLTSPNPVAGDSEMLDEDSLGARLMRALALDRKE